MAKRVRGGRSSHRPGGQGPSRTRKTQGVSTAATAPTPGAAPDVDIDEALELVAFEGEEIEYTEIAIEEPAPVTRASRKTRRGARVKADSLQARVAAENVYVRADLRRIGVVTAILLISLAVAWVLFVVLDLLNLY